MTGPRGPHQGLKDLLREMYEQPFYRAGDKDYEVWLDRVVAWLAPRLAHPAIHATCDFVPGDRIPAGEWQVTIWADGEATMTRGFSEGLNGEKFAQARAAAHTLRDKINVAARGEPTDTRPFAPWPVCPGPS